MNKSGTAPQTIHLEQLEPRYLLSSMPLVQNQAHILDLSSQNRVGSLVGYPPPSYALVSGPRIKVLSRGIFPAVPSLLSRRAELETGTTPMTMTTMTTGQIGMTYRLPRCLPSFHPNQRSFRLAHWATVIRP